MQNTPNIRRSHFRFQGWTDAEKQKKFHDSVAFWEAEASAGRTDPSFKTSGLNVLQIEFPENAGKEAVGALIRVTTTTAQEYNPKAIVEFFAASGVKVEEEAAIPIEEGKFFAN